MVDISGEATAQTAYRRFNPLRERRDLAGGLHLRHGGRRLDPLAERVMVVVLVDEDLDLVEPMLLLELANGLNERTEVLVLSRDVAAHDDERTAQVVQRVFIVPVAVFDELLGDILVDGPVGCALVRLVVHLDVRVAREVVLHLAAVIEDTVDCSSHESRGRALGVISVVLRRFSPYESEPKVCIGEDLDRATVGLVRGRQLAWNIDLVGNHERELVVGTAVDEDGVGGIGAHNSAPFKKGLCCQGSGICYKTL